MQVELARGALETIRVVEHERVLAQPEHRERGLVSPGALAVTRGVGANPDEVDLLEVDALQGLDAKVCALLLAIGDRSRAGAHATNVIVVIEPDAIDTDHRDLVPHRGALMNQHHRRLARLEALNVVDEKRDPLWCHRYTPASWSVISRV